MIAQTFWPVDVHNILQVPFGAPDTADKLVWAFSKSGQFTVRSCYHNLISGKARMAMASSSLVGSASPEWDWIWELRIPPKVRMFIWRACHEILPTRVGLMRRHVGTNPFCAFCSHKIETEAHIFFECPMFADIWMKAPLWRISSKYST